jgi:hypothetical protein
VGRKVREPHQGESATSGCPDAHGVESEDLDQALNHAVVTAANRLRTIHEKLHVTNRTQAALYALRHGWAALDEPTG